MPNLDSLENILVNKITAGISVFVLLVLAGYNLVGTNVLATRGFDLMTVEQKTIALEKENRQLQVKIDESSRLQSLEDVASLLGYSRASNIVMLPTPATTAMR